MAIYTKTGDKGTTSLFGGKRLSKSDTRIEAYGSLDELTSFIGVVLTQKRLEAKHKKLLLQIQKELYEIMAYLAGAKVPIIRFEQAVNLFEQQVDVLTSRLPKLHRFILPGGTELGGWFHVLRAEVRHSEREVVRHLKSQKSTPETAVVLQYLNRMSDLFFTLARWYSKGKEIEVTL